MSRISGRTWLIAEGEGEGSAALEKRSIAGSEIREFLGMSDSHSLQTRHNRKAGCRGPSVTGLMSMEGQRRSSFDQFRRLSQFDVLLTDTHYID